MRRALLATTLVAAALALAGIANGGSDTTNAPSTFAIKVIIRDKALSVTPSHAVRGSMVTFVVTNRGTRTHTFVLDMRHGARAKTTLRPRQRFEKVMFLNYRGVMTLASRTGARTVARGTFTVK